MLTWKIKGQSRSEPVRVRVWKYCMFPIFSQHFPTRWRNWQLFRLWATELSEGKGLSGLEGFQLILCFCLGIGINGRRWVPSANIINVRGELGLDAAPMVVEIRVFQGWPNEDDPNCHEKCPSAVPASKSASWVKFQIITPKLENIPHHPTANKLASEWSPMNIA